MAKRIFLDIGAHKGLVIDEVLKSYYNIDKIYCFEPCKVNYNTLINRYKNNEKVIINKFGLSNKTESKIIYAPGNMGASIFKDKIFMSGTNSSLTDKVKLVEASEWFSDNINKDDIIFMKLNCEGSECDIIENLLDKNMYDWVDHIFIDFDVLKIPSQKHRKKEILDKLVNKKNFYSERQIRTEKNIGYQECIKSRIRNWYDLSVHNKTENLKKDIP